MTTPADPDDLIAWLRAQLDDDERAATNGGKLSGDEWAALEVSPDRAGWEVVRRGGGVVAEATEWEAKHIARQDPARVLRQVAAVRRILDEVVDEATGLDMRVDSEFRVGRRDEAAEPYLGDVLLRLLALPYADRPGYREEWRP